MDEKSEKVMRSCNYFLNYHYEPRSTKEILLELASYSSDKDYADSYGIGEYTQEFEASVAKILGKESAVFMPSGTMAQQIALRIWCEKKNNFKVAFHPTAHLEIAEYFGYSFLHNIKRVPFSAPELLSHRLLTLDDIQGIQEQIAVLLLELPQRPIGCQLPSWEELNNITNWAKEHQVKLHLDGARLWECKSFYNRSYEQISNSFDSVYVSFYKDLGGLTGALLAGDSEFISEAKIWQRRHGGNLKTQFPYIVSAKLGLENHLNKMDLYVKKAKEIANVFNQFDQIEILPNPPHTNMFHMYLRGECEKLSQAHLELAEKYKIWLFNGIETSLLSSYCQTEIMIGDNALKLDLDIVAQFIGEMFKK
ncbi:MAG: threonine aldolase family protein [Candidatus Thorarchaeota archaeon]